MDSNSLSKTRPLLLEPTAPIDDTSSIMIQMSLDPKGKGKPGNTSQGLKYPRSSNLLVSIS